MLNTEYDPGQGRQHFERPVTLFNRSIRWLADHRPHAELPQNAIEALRDNSIDVFKTIAVDHEALEKVRTETKWYMANISCPSMVLGGEVTVDNDGNEPEVRFFADAPVLAIKGVAKRMTNLLSTTDHFTGHLYAYYTGASDYDENAAVYWQNRAAAARAEAGDARFQYRPLINALSYKKHKQIPYEAYSPRFKPFMKPLSLGTPLVERCVLRYPEVMGWSRICTVSSLTGIITTYERQVNDHRLAVSKEGRPQASDIARIAQLEADLQRSGVAQPEDLIVKGGFSEFMGY